MAIKFLSPMVLLSTFAVPLIFIGLCKLLSNIWWTPRRIKRGLEAQGIKGPPFKILYGNISEVSALSEQARTMPVTHISHNNVPRVLPHYHKWAQEYGNPFVYSLGYQCRLIVPDPEHCKEVLSNKFGHYPKPTPPPALRDVLANGLVNLDGEKWVEHRRILSPAFFVEKLKGMIPQMVNLTARMLEKWQQQIQEEERCKEIEVNQEFRILTADIIAHTAFGSSYSEGKQVFDLQQLQQGMFRKIIRSMTIPGSRSLCTISEFRSPMCYSGMCWKSVYLLQFTLFFEHYVDQLLGWR